MGELSFAMASSHAFAVTDLPDWAPMRLKNRQIYEGLYGQLPVEQPAVGKETPEFVRERYALVRGALESLRAQLERARPDALVLVADDQHENFADGNVPQFAIYVGNRLRTGRRGSPDVVESPTHPALAAAILEHCVASDIDLARIERFPDDLLFAHAFGPVLRIIDPGATIPIVPVFVNAIHVPAPSPARCYHVGRAIRAAVERFTGVREVGIYGSGGLSHFTAGYPWRHYSGPFRHGAIDEPFDRRVIEWLKSGRGSALAELSGDDLLEHGEIELRSWIVALGAIGDVPPALLVYEPLYSGIMGMGVGSWTRTAT